MIPALALALASTALAAPQLAARDGKPQTVLYWGQNTKTVLENPDLASYCKPDSGVDIVVLSFLFQYGKGDVIPGGSFDRSCGVTRGTGQPKGCENLAKAVATCQAAGVKVLVSLGGASDQYSLGSKEEAEKIAQNVWEAYGPVGPSKVPRPFGNAVLDGFDFDIENSQGSKFYPDMIAKLRSNFPKGSKFVISGAPQCPIPEPNVQKAIEQAQFDYLFVQFYNSPSCAATKNPNFGQWKAQLAKTPSKNAKIFLGVPASPTAANDDVAISKSYYVNPANLLTLVNKFKSDPAFGGIMTWSAGFSDQNIENKCNFVQQAKSILTKGKVC